MIIEEEDDNEENVGAVGGLLKSVQEEVLEVAMDECEEGLDRLEQCSTMTPSARTEEDEIFDELFGGGIPGGIVEQEQQALDRAAQEAQAEVEDVTVNLSVWPVVTDAGGDVRAAR